MSASVIYPDCLLSRKWKIRCFAYAFHSSRAMPPGKGLQTHRLYLSCGNQDVHDLNYWFLFKKTQWFKSSQKSTNTCIYFIGRHDLWKVDPSTIDKVEHNMLCRQKKKHLRIMDAIFNLKNTWTNIGKTDWCRARKSGWIKIGLIMAVNNHIDIQCNPKLAPIIMLASNLMSSWRQNSYLYWSKLIPKITVQSYYFNNVDYMFYWKMFINPLKPIRKFKIFFCSNYHQLRSNGM